MKLTPEQLREQLRKPAYAKRNPELFHPENYRQSPRAEPQRPARDESLPEVPAPPRNSQRFSVRIISFRSRLLDPDNLVGKAFCDCLRYAGILPDDSAAIMDYSISQQKCSKAEERTEIIVEAIL